MARLYIQVATLDTMSRRKRFESATDGRRQIRPTGLIKRNRLVYVAKWINLTEQSYTGPDLFVQLRRLRSSKLLMKRFVALSNTPHLETSTSLYSRKQHVYFILQCLESSFFVTLFIPMCSCTYQHKCSTARYLRHFDNHDLVVDLLIYPMPFIT